VIRNRYFYIGDFLPTLLSISNSNAKVTDIDGIDLSKMLLNDRPPYRSEVLTIDNIFHYSSYIKDNFKLVNGSSSENATADEWLGSNNNTDINGSTYISSVLKSKTARALHYPLTSRRIKSLRKRTTIRCSKAVANECDLLRGPCLFDIANDPCEKFNLATTQSELLNSMVDGLNEILKTVAPSRRQLPDPNCDPKFFNFTWTNWADFPPNVV
jgi:arylsulfatase B